MSDALSPEAQAALGQVYAFLLNRRRARLARAAQPTAAAEPLTGDAATAADDGPGQDTVGPILEPGRPGSNQEGQPHASP